MKPCLVYSDKYDFKLSWLNILHPFDGGKFSKAWKLVTEKYSDSINSLWCKPVDSISNEVLLKVHKDDYLESLNNSSVIAKVVEIGVLKFIPNFLLQKMLIEPVRLACNGTVIAAELALKNNNIVLNFGGGYHHAFPDHGEGFCFFADAAVSYENCKAKGLLSGKDKVIMIDLDAHRGNGYEATIKDPGVVKNFDMYGFQSYPGIHPGEIDDFPYMIPLKAGMKDEKYLEILESELPSFLDENSDAKLVYYNAGNDILDNDPLGSLKVSYQGVVQRDKFVIEQLNNRGIPTVIMTSGGYTKSSHKLIAELADSVISIEC